MSRRAAGLLLVLAAAAPGVSRGIAAPDRPLPDLVPLVNPFIGTADSNSPNPVPGGAGGSTYPGATAPFGMVQLSPDTPNGSPSGYAWKDTVIEGFSATHYDGAGCPNNEDVPMMPVTGALVASPGTNWKTYASAFSKASEAAIPGYYKVRLDASDVLVELTATTRVGFARYTYPAAKEATVLVAAGRSATGSRTGSIEVVGDRRLRGSATAGGFCGSPKTFQVHFAIEFDRAFTGFGTWVGDRITNGSRSAADLDCGGYATFDTTTSPVVQMKIGLSFVDVKGAEENLAKECPGFDFERVRKDAAGAWNRILNRIQVKGGTDAERTMFYTALYHVFQNPTIASDVDGRYMGFDLQVHVAEKMIVYQNYSGWDIYRSWIQLMAVIAPEETTDIVKSLVLDGQQGGLLPKWSQQNQECFVMTGDPGPIIVSSAYAFGIRDFDTEAALALMKHLGTVGGATTQGGAIRGRVSEYLFRGYISGDASDSLEYSASDFAIAQFAFDLDVGGDNGDLYSACMERAAWWQNVFNPESGYVHPRNKDGAWLADLHPASNAGFTEGNAAQYTWMVPYDMRALIRLMGGRATAVQRLDHHFSELNAGLTRPFFYIGNEPEHGVPWAYAFAGAPHKTQSVVRRIVTECFTPDPGGLPGNDDLGAMSAWFVWACLGIYPAIPGTDVLVIHGPLFPSAIVSLAGGRMLRIVGEGAGTHAPYVHDLVFDGRPSTAYWFRFGDQFGGGALEFTMGDRPNASWGSRASPPAYWAQFPWPPPPLALGENLALGKTVTSSAPCNAAESAENAVDGRLEGNSKWCSLEASSFLQVDLEAETEVSTVVIKHAGLGGESTAWNTADFEVRTSLDGSSFTTVASVTGNRASRTTHEFAATKARYVRLVITAPIRVVEGAEPPPPGVSAARIYEFEVYGPP